MSLFGSSPPGEAPSMESSFARSRQSLFDDDEATTTPSQPNSLFNDDDMGSGARSPWDMPTPRKQQTRADLLKSLLPASDVPDSYIDTFDVVVREDGSAGSNVSSRGVARTLAAAKLAADQQARINNIIMAGGEDVSLGRNEFNVLLALIGLAQEGENVSLDGVDERRRDLPKPKLPGLADNAPVLPNTAELAAKPPQRPVTPPSASQSPPPKQQPKSANRVTTMNYPEDPWNTPELHKTHSHGPDPPRTNGTSMTNPIPNGSEPFGTSPSESLPRRTTSSFTTNTAASGAGDPRQNSTGMGQTSAGGWDFFSGGQQPVGGFNPSAAGEQVTSPFGAGGGEGGLGFGGDQPQRQASRSLGGGGRPTSTVDENIVVTLMPEKEGIFMFQHHNYEVSSTRRGSKVVRRYSDFVWLLDCLHKRYPFRVLPLLPPKRVAVNGNHLSNDGAFIEKRRRGLARFLNALVRHPVLGQEQLVIMFLTVPTELSVWRKQATISVQDEFADRALPPGLEESLSPQLNDLFEKTRSGVRRSAELYINVCNIMDRLSKRSEGVAADHARIALALTSLTETSEETYATDTSEVAVLNEGLVSMSTHLRTAQSLLEDEAKAWDQGVLEDLKRQRDALVSVRDLFDRRERLDRDNIPQLERRIQSNETKLANLRAKPEGLVKPGEIEKVVEAIIKVRIRPSLDHETLQPRPTNIADSLQDKESIVTQHNRSVFVKECLRDELVYFQQTQYHVSRWNQDWAQERVKYAEMLADNWRRLLDELDGMPLGD